jgi:hypothetical protein
MVAPSVVERSIGRAAEIGALRLGASGGAAADRHVRFYGASVVHHTDREVRAFARAFERLATEAHRLVADDGEPVLKEAIEAHLGVVGGGLPVVEQLFPVSDHPNLQLALESIARESDDSCLFGLPIEVFHWSGFSLTNLASPRPQVVSFAPVAPAYVNLPVGVDRTLPCVSIGVWLLRHATHLVVLLLCLGDPHRGMNVGVKVEVMATERAVATAFLTALGELAGELNVYRGQMLSFTFDQWGSFAWSSIAGRRSPGTI